MGIDIYARWDGQTGDEHAAQITGFHTHGAAGYLREAYHGGPYATRVLVPEAFADDRKHTCNESDRPCEACQGVHIPWKTLARRLPQAVVAALIREAEIYGNKEARTLLCEVGVEPRLGQERPGVVDIAQGESMTVVLERMLARCKEAAYPPASPLPMPTVAPTDAWFDRVMAVAEVRALFEFVALLRLVESNGRHTYVYASY